MRASRSLAVLALLGACASPQERARERLAERGIAADRPQLLAALEGGDAEAAELLLAAGVTGSDALFRAVRHGHCELAPRLIAAGVPADDLWAARALRAARARSADPCVEVLVEAGARLDGRNSEGENQLTSAAADGALRRLRRILDHDFPVDELNARGETALVVAARRDRQRVVRFLLAAGADPDAVDDDGWTALAHAARAGATGAVEALLDGGADPSSRCLAGWTPLHWAVREGRREIVPRLLAAGADVNAASPAALTPLIRAVERGDSPAVRALIAAGADSRQQVNRTTAATWAVAAGHPEVVADLAPAGPRRPGIESVAAEDR